MRLFCILGLLGICIYPISCYLITWGYYLTPYFSDIDWLYYSIRFLVFALIPFLIFTFIDLIKFNTRFRIIPVTSAALFSTIWVFKYLGPYGYDYYEILFQNFYGIPGLILLIVSLILLWISSIGILSIKGSQVHKTTTYRKNSNTNAGGIVSCPKCKNPINSGNTECEWCGHSLT